ncbi:MAG TPA: haloacid dehalogenase type II [Streptosporangiaceae bacterium]|nr:haloacid dehalogenase type II [Streptosporangiaceae bacterium]
MQPRPRFIVFDVNETLSDMAPMGRRFAEVGAPELLATVWFAALLRDGFALTVTGGKETFSQVGEAALRTVLTGATLDRPLDDAVGHILSGFTGLSVHPDVPDGVRALREAGLTLVTLTNGTVTVADQLLTSAGIRRHFDRLLSVDDADAWKPAAAAYAYAARACSAEIGEMLLVAVHPWDIHGANRAGMRTGWINRRQAPYPGYFATPDVTAPDLSDLAGQIV